MGYLYNVKRNEPDETLYYEDGYVTLGPLSNLNPNVVLRYSGGRIYSDSGTVATCDSDGNVHEGGISGTVFARVRGGQITDVGRSKVASYTGADFYGAAAAATAIIYGYSNKTTQTSEDGEKNQDRTSDGTMTGSGSLEGAGSESGGFLSILNICLHFLVLYLPLVLIPVAFFVSPIAGIILLIIIGGGYVLKAFNKKKNSLLLEFIAEGMINGLLILLPIMVGVAIYSIICFLYGIIRMGLVVWKIIREKRRR